VQSVAIWSALRGVPRHYPGVVLSISGGDRSVRVVRDPTP
jgi:hypothetical protein